MRKLGFGGGGSGRGMEGGEEGLHQSAPPAAVTRTGRLMDETGEGQCC